MITMMPCAVLHKLPYKVTSFLRCAFVLSSLLHKVLCEDYSKFCVVFLPRAVQHLYLHHAKDQSILLLFSPIFLSDNSFFWPIMLKILLKVKLYS